MKTLLLKTIILTSTIISFVGCQDTVQIELEAQAKILTVDAFLNTMRIDQKIRLTYTDNYFSGKQSPPLYGATVTLKDLTRNLTYNFEDQYDGNYVFNLLDTDSIIHTNHYYELNIKYQDYEYRAFTKCKRTVMIDSLFFKNVETGNMGTGIQSGNRLFLAAKDLTGPIPDFYWIKIYKNGKFYARPENIQLEHFGYNNELDGQYFGEEKWKTSGPNEEVDPCNTGDIARLEIHGISRETHDFLRLGIQMNNNIGLFATTSVNLPTNITALDKNYPKAVGMFNISDVAFKAVVCP